MRSYVNWKGEISTQVERRIRCLRILIRSDNMGERIRIWLAFVFERQFIIVGAGEPLALSRTRDFHSASAFVRKDVFIPSKLRGLQVPQLGDTAHPTECGRLSHRGWHWKDGWHRPASLDLVFREKNVAIFIGIPLLPTGENRILWESVFSFDLGDLRRRGCRREIKGISSVRPSR